jgi:4-aminobutyrate aminotransferase/diaminobutyrate-pyruvate transaminase/4-aminobutyrate aminotransferase/(S)-3-amino-2-methylpropionate transaminase
MDQYPPGSMTSTHTGNPVCCAATLANLKVIEDEKLVANAARMGEIMQRELRAIGQRFGEHIAHVSGKGLVASLHIVKSGPPEWEPDADRARDIVWRCVEKGVMLFSPVGYAGACVKISPPLCISEDALREGVAVIGEAVGESMRQFEQRVSVDVSTSR